MSTPQSLRDLGKPVRLLPHGQVETIGAANIVLLQGNPEAPLWESRVACAYLTPQGGQGGCSCSRTRRSTTILRCSHRWSRSPSMRGMLVISIVTVLPVPGVFDFADKTAPVAATGPYGLGSGTHRTNP